MPKKKPSKPDKEKGNGEEEKAAAEPNEDVQKTSGKQKMEVEPWKLITRAWRKSLHYEILEDEAEASTSNDAQLIHTRILVKTDDKWINVTFVYA